MPQVGQQRRLLIGPQRKAWHQRTQRATIAAQALGDGAQHVVSGAPGRQAATRLVQGGATQWRHRLAAFAPALADCAVAARTGQHVGRQAQTRGVDAGRKRLVALVQRPPLSHEGSIV